MLSDGTDLYGKGYSDCMLAVRTPLIEKNPAAVKAVIKALIVAPVPPKSDKTSRPSRTRSASTTRPPWKPPWTLRAKRHRRRPRDQTPSSSQSIAVFRCGT